MSSMVPSIYDANQGAMSLIPQNILQQAERDVAMDIPGAPPLLGQMAFPHIFTMAARYGLVSHAYLTDSDEALRHSRANAYRMDNDCVLQEPLEARQRAVAMLPWHIQPENEHSQDQKELAGQLEMILRRTPEFTEVRRQLLTAVFYGRYGVAMQFGSAQVGDHWRTVISRTEPRHGDKLVFRFDDGSHEYRDGQVGIRIASTTQMRGRPMDQWQNVHGKLIQATETGLVRWLTVPEMRTLLVHKHMKEDGPYEDTFSAGRVHGVGIRSKIYWTWYLKQECLQRALDYLDRAALGVEIWRYPAGNPQAKANVEEAAAKYVGGGRSIILFPVLPGDLADSFSVEHIEPGLAGVDSLMQVIKDYFDLQIKRYIMGQTLTSEAEATGLGSGVADAHLATFADIVAYDARNLEETLTSQLVRTLQLWNFPQSAHYHMKFAIDTESDNAGELMEAIRAAYDMGIRMKESDVADKLGISLAQNDDRAVFNPMVTQQMEQARQVDQRDPIQSGLEYWARNYGVTSQAAA